MLRGNQRDKNKIQRKDCNQTGKKIEKGTVEEHPAWEDLIVLENLEERIKNIRKELTALKQE